MVVIFSESKRKALVAVLDLATQINDPIYGSESVRLLFSYFHYISCSLGEYFLS